MGSLRLYDDAVCSSQFEQASLASTKEKYVDVLPPDAPLEPRRSRV